MMPFTVGSLFSGIGGFELGLERTGGFKTVWQCEIDPFCQKILEKHWPDVKRFTDIKKMGIEEGIPHVNVICGGFPCQPVSCAGKRKGKEDERWLWPEFYRVVRCVRPEWVLIENVPGLLSADSGRLFAGILRDLSESGYNAEWNIVSAASVGAPHLRKRVFIVAHCTSQQNDPERQESRRFGELERRTLEGGREALRQENGQASNNVLGGCRQDVADSDQIRRYGRAGVFWQGRRSESEDCCAEFPDTSSEGLPQPEQEWQHGRPTAECGWWTTEPDVGRVANGVPSRVDRLRALGNAIVPQCAQFVGQCLLDSIKAEAAQ